MNTAKEWLKANGHIAEIGRGRISNDNHKRLLAAVEQGVKFTDYPKGGKVVKAVTGETVTETYVKPPAPTGEVIAELYFRYDEKDYQAVGKSGKVYGMREACNNCHYSLTGHICDEPSVLGESVEVVRRR
jgi:hypothetical protein